MLGSRRGEESRCKRNALWREIGGVCVRLVPFPHRNRLKDDYEGDPQWEKHNDPGPVNDSIDAETEEHEKQEKEDHHRHHVSEAAFPLLVKPLVRELHKGVTHVLPLMGEDPFFDMKLIGQPGDKI